MEWKFKPKDLKVKKVLSDVISQEIEGLNKLNNEDKEIRNNDLKDMIRYYFDLNNNIELRCAKICNFALHFLVIAIIASSLLYTFCIDAGIEAYKNIQEAKIPFIVAINKIDKPNANVEKVTADLFGSLI